MPSPAKIEANRRNALLSTGPRTAAGKLVVAQNAIRHGVYANLPVVPGESELDWRAHREGIVRSFAPSGLLEVNLAERVALLLWRLARLARYEAVNTAAAVEDAGLLSPDVFPTPNRHHNHDSQLSMAEQELRREREAFYAVRADAVCLRLVLDGSDDKPVPAKTVRTLLAEAYTLALDCPVRQSQPLWYTDRSFLDRQGIPADQPQGEAWLRDQVLVAVDYYAEATEWPADEFRAELLRTFDGRVDGYSRAVRRREAEVIALNRRLDAEAERSAATALIPPDAVADRIIKYEKHLHAQLTSTLHELERLQARRGGVFVPPPAVADLHVILNGD